MTGPTPQRPARSGWWALGVTVLARATLTVLVSLLGWSLVPSLLGWHTTVVMTGSMLPNLVPGDIVVSRPIDPTQVRIGQVLLVDNPDHAGELRMHRLVRISASGQLILRGDANRTADSTPVDRSAVHGVGALHIPKLGLPFLWAANGRYGPLLITAALLALLVRLAFWWRPSPRSRGISDIGNGDDISGAGDNTGDGDPAAAYEPAPAVEASGAIPRPAVARTAARRSVLIAVTVVVLVAIATANAEAAKYSGTASNPTNSFAANLYFSCANAVKGDAAAFALPLSESSGTTAADASGNGNTGTYSSTGVTYGVGGPCPRDAAKAVTLDGANGLITETTPPSGAAQSYEIWFKAPSTSTGGGLMSITNSGGRQTKMALAMTSAGKIVFAVGSSASSVTSTAAYNDNAWHLAVGTITGSAINLYVDRQGPVTLASSANATNAKCTIGWDPHGDLGTGTSDYFTGSIAFAAGYNLALTASQIAVHYAAGT